VISCIQTDGQTNSCTQYHNTPKLCAGFLSTEDGSAPGNYAILDLVAALHWIKENIAAFGGDADQVSLLGHGYGAALVNILLVSPITNGITIYQYVNSKYVKLILFWCDWHHPIYVLSDL